MQNGSPRQWGQIALTSELLKSKTLIYMMPLFLEAGCAQAASAKYRGSGQRSVNGPGKTVIAFCTGGSPAESPEIEAFLKRNFSGDEWKRVPVFYCPGGFCYEKMSAGSKLMMKFFQKMVEGKKDKTEADREMLKMIAHSYDISDKKYIEPIVKLLNDACNK